jgi:1,2-diacylglycerol 3-beta-glucosyltransferase
MAIVGDVLALSPVLVAPLIGYLSLLTGAAWWSTRSTRRGEKRRPALRPSTRFAVLIPAHDEERLIASTVRSLRSVDHPPELVSIHVVADHCTDATAAIARAEGAHVHLHDDPEPAGKGPALQWALRELDARGEQYDAAVIIDADSVVDREFFGALDAEMTAGASVVQAYYAVRDVDSSVSIGLRAAALAIRHHLRPLGRTALGGSCGLFGNGMAFRREILDGHDWSDHLTEDLEFQIELLLDGVRVAFAPDARLEAEMPTTLDDSRTQNERWERGRIELARRYVPTLVRRAAHERGRRRRALLDTAADLIVPPLSVLVAASVSTSLLSGVVSASRRSGATRFGRRTAVTSSVALVVCVLSGLRLANVPPSVYRSLAGAPVAIGWKVALWGRMLVTPDEVAWTRTARNVAPETVTQ